MKRFVFDYIEDILILLGLVVIIVTTFLLSTIAGMYTAGGVIFGLGVYFTIHPLRKG